MVGSIHGNETAGHAILRRLRERTPPAGVQLWLVETVNPDGVRNGTRQNARGVDLNRNFPFRWTGGGGAFDTYFAGPRRASEPETRAVQRAREARRARPDDLLPPAHAARGAAARASTARRSAPTPAASGCPPAGCRATRARRRRGRTIASRTRPRSWWSCPPARSPRAPPTATPAPCWPRGPPRPRAPRAAAAPKPAIRWDPIPFGADRKRQMRALLAPPLRRREGQAGRPEGDRRALHRVDHVQLRVQHVREQRARRRVRRAPRRLRALRDRSRRHDPPARLAALALPPHGRAQRHRDRDRARRRVRRRRDRPAAPARRLAAAHPLAAGPLRRSARAT